MSKFAGMVWASFRLEDRNLLPMVQRMFDRKQMIELTPLSDQIEERVADRTL